MVDEHGAALFRGEIRLGGVSEVNSIGDGGDAVDVVGECVGCGGGVGTEGEIYFGASEPPLVEQGTVGGTYAGNVEAVDRDGLAGSSRVEAGQRKGTLVVGAAGGVAPGQDCRQDKGGDSCQRQE